MRDERVVDDRESRGEGGGKVELPKAGGEGKRKKGVERDGLAD